MASISSLLKSAEAARKRKLAYEDDVAAFNWQNSAKTPDDWIEYQGYLQGRQSTSPTGSDQLSYAKKLKSAEDSYVSAELERESIKILEGTGTSQEKLQKVSTLLERAVERGNYDLAQNLYKQGLTLQDQIINEQEKAQRVAGAMATNGVKSVKELVSKLEKGDGIIQVNDEEAYKSLKSIGLELKGAGDTGAGLFTDAYLTTQAIESLVRDAYESATTQDAVDYIEKDLTLSGVLEGTRQYSVGDTKLTASEINLGYRSALANNPIYSVTTGTDSEGRTSFSLQKNQTEDFAWIRNDDGTYEAMAVQTRKTNESLNTIINDKGQVVQSEYAKDANGRLLPEDQRGNETMSLQNRLAQLGFLAEQGSDGKITLTDRNGRIYTDAVLEGGTLRFRGDPNEYSQGTAGLYEINITQQDNFGALGTLRAGTVRAVAPDETSDFGYKSEFGGQLGFASDAGRAATLSLSGVSPISTPRFNIDQVVESLIVKDVSAPRISGVDNNIFGVPGTSSLLQSAGTTRNILEEKNRAEELARIRSQVTSQALSLPNTPGLNQTPVRNISSSGAPVKQLKVSAPTPQRITSVSPVTPTRKITGVTSTNQFKGTLQVR